MTQKAKRSPRPKTAKTVPLMVVGPVATREEGEIQIERLLPKTHLDEVQIGGLLSKIHLDNVGLTVVESSVDKLKADIVHIITSLLPIVDALPAPEASKAGVDSLSLALAVNAQGQVGIATVVTGSFGVQAQASITVTLAKKKPS